MIDTFYRDYEERHRGARELIKSRLRSYLPFVLPLAAPSSARTRPLAIDVGCGRGEWLELLGEHGFDAQGVDLDEGMLLACRERGLNVRLADAVETMRSMPAGSAALVTAFHVVEHMPFDAVRALLREALRVLQPGGLVIFETPNPENLEVGASSFYQDPTHVRPLPPELLRFAADHAGFHRSKIVRLQEEPALRGDGAIMLENVLTGVSPDYSVVAQKAADEPTLAAFDDAFGTKFGITLHALATRYDRQSEDRRVEIGRAIERVAQHADQAHRHVARIDARIGEAEHMIGVARGEIVAAEGRVHDTLAASQASLQAALQARADDLLARIGYVDFRVEESNHRIAALEARLVQAEARANDLGERLIAVYDSSSWRITAPLRMVAGYAYRLRSAIREGRVKSGLRRRAVVALQALARVASRHPRVRAAALAVLDRMPALKRRLSDAMRPPAPPAPPAAPAAPDQLSPRTARCLADLRQAIATRKKT